ncbi:MULTISPECIES: Zn-dependent alcohol dehydrogenase [Sphingomonas]|jgi:S-(hydroxymethyl)glutathione dehydrogenase/alcohol dehydrogenase|uniref:Alcohol dehydrogenase n=1 Tax=Sphingomonas ginsenosidimutans TaxID=862134 RepID=A0A2A4I200_9SPHN|nr:MULTISPECIES: Zn-dependent alcohol dehydrogenase [Sphingomonas]MBY0301634.1 Zn-dependent alcohol dehydrogenase [Sphingomonas ginsenosidimutans]PCG10644.1 alcohol dehydrogenase [Sphingomonas ginsenosidimutans]
MKAAVLFETRQPLEVADVVVAKPAPREVLIRTRAVGVCRSDLHFVDGTYPHALPAIPGHEAAGVVEAVGSEVRTVKPGDHVVTCLSAFCGHCEFCITGRMFLCVSGETRRGKGEAPRLTLADGGVVNQMLNLSAYAEMMLVHEHACVAIDRDMPLDRAALIGCAVTTGAGAVFNTSDVSPGETVCVVGCGGIGLAAVNAAKIAGAGKIIALDPVPEKRAIAEKLGATHTFDALAEGVVAEVVELSKGGVDHAIEAVGRPQSAATTVSVLRRGGTATILGMMPLSEKVGLSAMDLLSGKKLQGGLMGSNRFPVDIPRLVDFYQRGLLDLDTIIAERVPLDRINHAFDELRKGDATRSVITFDA